MTATVELSRESRGAARGSAAVHAVLDELELDFAGLGVDEITAEVAGWERVVRRVEAVKLRMLALAQTNRIAEGSGMSGTDAWFARTTKSSRRDAAHQVRLATALDEGLDDTAAALGDGKVSTAHATVIAEATGRLPGNVSEEQRRIVERALVARAAHLDPVELKRAARRCLEALPVEEADVDAHEGGLLAQEEREAEARSELVMWDNSNGTTSGRFTVPHLAGAMLRKTIEQLASPRRAALGASRAQTGPVSFDRDALAHRAGEALVEILEHLPTDRLHPGTAANVVITIDESRLLDQLKAANLDNGARLSAGQARRIACNAGILPAVLDGKSRVTDLGHKQRLFTESQRIAIGLEHRTCAADGCQRPFAWCELHHVLPWSRGGPSDLANALPLCGFHHRRIHDRRYLHRIDTERGVTFHTRT